MKGYAFGIYIQDDHNKPTKNEKKKEVHELNFTGNLSAHSMAR